MTAMRRLRPLLLLALILLALLTLRDRRDVTDCAARGGRVDPRTGDCDARTFQAEPASRMDRAGGVMGAAVVALAGTGVAVWLRRRAIRVRQER